MSRPTRRKKMASLDTGIGAATTTSPGVVLKAAVLSVPPPTALTNNTTGTTSETLLGASAGTPVLLSDVITALLALIGVVNNNFATVNQRLNAEASRVEDLITKQQTAGQQT